MSIALLDVNVLVALFDPSHVNHDDAHRWFSRNRRFGWAACPITVNGFVRVLSNPAYPNPDQSAAGAAKRLHELCLDGDDHFWSDSVSLTDTSLFRLTMLGGHQKITDAYLLGLAVKNHGRLATFDQRIPMRAVIGSDPRNLVLIDRS